MRRVVVTGAGLYAPLTFEELLEGKCALRAPSGWELPGLGIRISGPTADPAALVRSLPGSWKPDRLDPVSQFALIAAHRARESAGLLQTDLGPASVSVSSSMGGERTHDAASRLLAEHLLTGKRLRLSPFTAPKLMPNASAANVSILLGAHGPSTGMSAACASGAYSIAQAFDWLRLGRAELAFAGASEAPCEEISARVFYAAEALSPTGSSLPFHQKRDGFVLAEGAAVLVLETLEHALARGAEILAELAGVGLSCDAYHVVAPHPEGSFARRAMELALREARVEPGEVDYINAHATGTPVGDVAEVRAIDELFSGCTPFVSSTKGATGHLLGAAGALEAAYTVQAIRTGCIPGTTGLTVDSVDPACSPQHARLLAAEPVETSVSVAISNSFAFGGHNATLVFRRYSN